QIRDRCRPAGQAVESRREVARQATGVEVETADDAVQIRVLQLQDLVYPVHQLDVGIAPQFAEDGGAFHGLVSETVQLAEQRRATDITHVRPPCPWLYRQLSAAACEPSSTASRATSVRAPSHVVHPSQPLPPSCSGGISAGFSSRRTHQDHSSLVYRRTRAL